MPIYAEVDGVGRLEFPDGTDPAVIQATVKRTVAGYQTPSQRRGENMNERVAKLPMGADQIIATGAGRQMDTLAQGLKQAGLGASVAGQELMGMPPATDQMRQMAEMGRAQSEKDRLYQPLKQEHPLLTGIGESAFLGAVPAGQATAAARVATPAIAAAMNGLLSYGDPKERMTNAVQQGVPALAGGALGEVARKLITPAQSTLSAAQQEALRRATEKVGYTPRASELTGSETLRRLEDAVARQPGGAQPMRDLLDKNVVAVNRHAGKAIGEQAEQLTEDVFGNASDRIGDTYNTLRSRAVMPVNQDVLDAVKRAEGFLDKGDKTGAKKEAFDMIQRLKDELYASKQFDGQTFQSWTSDLGSKARELGKTNRTAAAALREVEKAMDKVGQGADAPLWQQTDRQNSALEMLMKPGVVNAGNVSPVKVAGQMERQFGKNFKTGKMDGPMVDIAEMGRNLPPMREGSPTAGREAFGGLPGWMLAGPNYAAAKALTSELGRDYLSKGLLGNPAVSKHLGGLLGRGAVPLSIAEIEALMLGYQ